MVTHTSSRKHSLLEASFALVCPLEGYRSLQCSSFSLCSTGLVCCLLTDLSMALRQSMGFACFKQEQHCCLFLSTFTHKYCLCFYSDTRHVDWVKSYLNIWSELQAYIKEHHTTGLTWSKTVSTLSFFKKNHKRPVTCLSFNVGL